MYWAQQQEHEQQKQQHFQVEHRKDQRVLTRVRHTDSTKINRPGHNIRMY